MFGVENRQVSHLLLFIFFYIFWIICSLATGAFFSEFNHIFFVRLLVYASNYDPFMIIVRELRKKATMDSHWNAMLRAVVKNASLAEWVVWVIWNEAKCKNKMKKHVLWPKKVELLAALNMGFEVARRRQLIHYFQLQRVSSSRLTQHTMLVVRRISSSTGWIMNWRKKLQWIDERINGSSRRNFSPLIIPHIIFCNFEWRL